MATDSIVQLLNAISSLNLRKTARDKSRHQQQYLASAKKVAAIIEKATNRNSFAEGLAILKESQINLFLLLAVTNKEKQTVQDIFEALEIGEIHYHVLRDEPDFYRDKLAAGYQKRDRLPPDKIVPKDGMHYALESYARHMATRHSAFIADEEKLLINAHVTLAAAMRRDYQELQRKALA